MDASTFLFDLFKVLCYTDLHLGLMRFYRFLAPFSQFSRKFPGSCEERAVLGGISGRFRDYSGRFGKDCEVLEIRLSKPLSWVRIEIADEGSFDSSSAYSYLFLYITSSGFSPFSSYEHTRRKSIFAAIP